jgi:hypothetical protein
MRALSVHIAHEIAGAARIRHSLRPLSFEGEEYLQTSGAMRRENAKVYPPSLRAQQSNPSRRIKEEWIASSQELLAMTASTNAAQLQLSSPATGSAEWPPDDRLRRATQYS